MSCLLSFVALKKPLGIVRILLLLTAVLAFALTCGYSACAVIVAAIDSPCAAAAPTKERDICWSYPFRLHLTVANANCDNATINQAAVMPYDLSSAAEFFVCACVLTFLWCMASLFLYIGFWHKRETDSRYAYVDLCVTTVLAVFIFSGSCAWASGVSQLKYLTSNEHIRQVTITFPICTTPDSAPGIECALVGEYDYVSLNFSLLFGFVCFGLLVTSVWLVIKETVWYKSRSKESSLGVIPPATVVTPTATNRMYESADVSALSVSSFQSSPHPASSAQQY